MNQEEIEAINKDGEEVIDYFGETSKGEQVMYFVAGSICLIPIIWLIGYLVSKIFDIIKS